MKYKNKYISLKRQFGGSNFNTIKNDGRMDAYSQQCFWISIMNYLNYNLNQNISIRRIREIGSTDNTNINKVDEPWDDFEHLQSAFNVADEFGLTIQIFLPDRLNGDINIRNPAINIGSGNNMVRIVQFIDHFELITSLDNDRTVISLNEEGKSKESSYKTNVDVASYSLTKKLNGRELDSTLLNLLLEEHQKLLILQNRKKSLEDSIARYIFEITQIDDQIAKLASEMNESDFVETKDDSLNLRSRHLHGELDTYKKTLENTILEINNAEHLINDMLA
jgi:hypothetical protein